MFYDVEVDIGMYFEVMPPLIIPISERAKEFLGLDEGVDAGIAFETTPEETIGCFPEDWVVATMENCDVSLIAVLTIKQLH